MSNNSDIKLQRDRFLAFSFASADLFMEITATGIVDYALGAARSLTGIDETKLMGEHWMDLFASQDRPVLMSMIKNAVEGQRSGPHLVTMDENVGRGQKAIITGIRVPNNDRFYVALGFATELMEKLAELIEQAHGKELHDKDHFIYAAQEALELSRSMGQDIDMTLFDIPNAGSIKEKMGDEVWGSFTEAVTDFLAKYSIDGHTAAMIKEGRYSLIHDTKYNSDTLQDELHNLTKKADPNEEGFDVRSKTVSADLQSLSERETTKALIYTINEFERKGTALNIESLNSGFKAYVSANAQKISQFKTMVEQLSFDLHFQPIVVLDRQELSHYEILSRFKEEGSTQEWVIFAEDIGMAPDFDIAVCERVINYLLYKASGNRNKFGVNLSGQSMQNEQFFKTLMAKLTLHKDLAQRIIFEITESNTITELEMVNHFIKQMQGVGFKVCLDDFGAGAASFQYIQNLHVDFIKIDGQYTRRIINSHRDQVMVKSLAQMCKELGIATISEQIETLEEVEMMKKLGINLGQGHYYGYSGPIPHFDPEKLPAEPPTRK